MHRGIEIYLVICVWLTLFNHLRLAEFMAEAFADLVAFVHVDASCHDDLSGAD